MWCGWGLPIRRSILLARGRRGRESGAIDGRSIGADQFPIVMSLGEKGSKKETLAGGEQKYRSLTPDLLWKQARGSVRQMGSRVLFFEFCGLWIKLSRSVNPGDPCSAVPAVTSRGRAQRKGHSVRPGQRLPILSQA